MIRKILISICVLLSLVLVAYVCYKYTLWQAINKYSTGSLTPIASPTPNPSPMVYSSYTPQLPPKNTYKWGDYPICIVYSRSNMNTYGSNGYMFDNASEIRCQVDGAMKTMVSVTDKQGYPNAENSIYRFWKDNEGYNIMIVDQNGAGSGEGHAKILLVTQTGYLLRNCFYFTWESFHPSLDYNKPSAFGTALSNQEWEVVKSSKIDIKSEYCSNFSLSSKL